MPHIPIHPSAQKRHRQSLKRAERNRTVRTRARSLAKTAAETIATASDEAKAREAHNASFDGGKVTSILCGLRAVPDDADAILLLAVDQPRPARILRTLIESHEAAMAPITVPLNEGHRGHPIIFTAALLPELRSIDEATLGVRAVLERHADEINEVAFGDPMVRLDLNTPDDAERARRMLGPSV